MKDSRKIIIRKLGVSFRDSTELVAKEIPTPGPDEVLIRNHFAGVNGVYDEMMCHDRIDHIEIVPPVDTGVEAVGEVIACGEQVTALREGDSVASAIVGNGYCHYQVCPASSAIPIPKATPDILALLPSGVSALLALEKVGEMRPDDRVCVSAAAGGLGNIMVQLAVNAGHEVIAVCGSDEKAESLGRMGVARVIQYRRESVAEVLAAEYKDRLDLVMDSVGGGLFDSLVENLAPFGRLVVCGFTSDRLPTAVVEQERIYSKLYWKAASVRGFMNYRFASFAPEARKRLLEMLQTGDIKPLLDGEKFIGLESVADAVERLLAGDNCGKVVVDLRP